MRTPGDLPGVLIRADADAQTGTGHLVRCLALAQVLQRHHHAVAFVGHCPAALRHDFIEASGIDISPMDGRHPDPSDLQTVLTRLGRLAAAHARRPWLILDGYPFDPAYHRAVREAGARLLVVDDTAHLSRYDADVVVNQSIGADGLAYRCDPATLLLLGPAYAMLRTEFQRWRRWERQILSVARKILITLGGSDPGNVTRVVVDALNQVTVDGLEACVVVGAVNPHHEMLRAAARDARVPVRVVRNVSNMADLMAWADVAVAAGGGTCWELAFMGLPSLLLVLGENQRGNAEGLGAADAAVNLGPYAGVTAVGIAQRLETLCRDAPQRSALSANSRRLVDGDGPERIAMIIDALHGTPLGPERLGVRRATPRDAVPLWRLANDPEVRTNAFTPEAIPLAHHLEWYGKKLSSPGTRIWILEFAGVLVAQIRYDRVDSEVAEISFSVVPAMRGKGLGAKVLGMTWPSACEELGVRRVRGSVFTRNEPSSRAFLKAGFRRVEEAEIRGHRCYVFEHECC